MSKEISLEEYLFKNGYEKYYINPETGKREKATQLSTMGQVNHIYDNGKQQIVLALEDRPPVITIFYPMQYTKYFHYEKTGRVEIKELPPQKRTIPAPKTIDGWKIWMEESLRIK